MEQRSTHDLGPILIAYKMTTSNSSIKCPLVLLDNAQEIPLSILQNFTMKRNLKLKVFRMLGVHQTLFTIQNGFLKCYFYP